VARDANHEDAEEQGRDDPLMRRRKIVPSIANYGDRRPVRGRLGAGEKSNENPIVQRTRTWHTPAMSRIASQRRSAGTARAEEHVRPVEQRRHDGNLLQ